MADPRPCVIAIHGAVANAATWLPLQAALGEKIDVLAEDLPGHGTRRGEPFVLDAAIAALAERAVAEAALRQVVLAGDSLGGYLALAVAARAGSAIAGVVAGSCTFPMRGVAALAARASLLVDPLVPAAAFPALLRRVSAPDVAAAILARGLAPAMRGVTLRALLGYDVLADVAAIPAPIVFVDGAFDVPIVLIAERFVRAARVGRAIVVPRASHGVGLTHAHVFAQAVQTLFARALR